MLCDGVLYCGRQDCSDMHSWGPGVRSLYVLHYVVRGKGYFEVGKKKYQVEAGQSFLIRPFEKIYYYPDENDPWEYMWIDFDIPMLNDLIEAFNFEKGNHVTAKVQGKYLIGLFEELFSRFEYSNTPYACYGLAYSILATYIDKLGIAKEKAQKSSSFLTALKIIKENYHLSDFRIEAICGQMGISRSTLHRMFTENTQLSPNKFLMQYRINKASEMLALGLSVKNSAFSCGFSDAYYFSKVFKNIKGISPSEFKK